MLQHARKTDQAGSQTNPHPVYVRTRERPELVRGTTSRMPTGCGDLYLTVNHDDTGPVELFATIGKCGGCAGSMAEAIGRLVSLCLRSGVDPAAVSRQLTGIRCPNPCWKDGELILSCSDAIGKTIRRQDDKK